MRCSPRTIRAIAGGLAGSIGLGLLYATCFATAAAAASRSEAPTFVQAFGQSGPKALSQPFGVAIDQSRHLWVVDKAAGQVSEFSLAGKPLTRFGGAGVLLDPEGIAAGPGGNLWVADTGHDRIVEFSPQGARLRTFGSAGRGLGFLRDPIGLAMEPDGILAVADSGNNRIDLFTVRGAYVAEIHVATPVGVAVSASGDLWVSSSSYAAGNAIYEFSPGRHRIREFGGTQATYGALSDPAGIAIGPHGRVYVAQPDYGIVTIFNPGGGFHAEFGLTAKIAQANQDLAFPQDVALVGGVVYVADSGNGRIAEFSPPVTAGQTGAASAVRAGADGWGLAGLIVVLVAALVLAGMLLARLRGRRSGGAVLAPAAGTIQASLAAKPAPAELAVSRRTLLAGATALTGATVGAGVLPASLRRAVAATASRSGSAALSDIKHVVILMQENRSFDHYYGTMPGVRGFNDPTAITLASGRSVFHQPDSSHAQGYLLPFHYDTKKTSAQATPGTDHSWPTQHQAWHNGKMDQWIAAKGEYTMGYFAQDDIPFHWALADAFTICDNYHCSVFGPTNPNRLYMWTGMIDPAGKHGGPVIDNTPAFNNVILSWTTYPERLEKAGISWQVYQEDDNFDDNALAWFKQYGHAPRTSPLYRRGMRKLPAGAFEYDAKHDRLPQVSWLVAPTAQSEHPDYFPAAGAEYIAQKLDAIASNPQVWAKTAFILCYDENDGLFDHVPPPTPARGTAAEFVGGEPIGLGFRTPTTIVSPWTAGGFVCSDVFDHSSLIRFLEARFGVHEPNISAWRRQTCGDLTSAFRFSGGAVSYPGGNTRLRLATTEAGLLTAQHQVNKNPAPRIPAVNQPLP
jgi:phospholipase C